MGSLGRRLRGVGRGGGIRDFGVKGRFVNLCLFWWERELFRTGRGSGGFWSRRVRILGADSA